ncbi:MAG TPA: phosphatase PAP2 family protein [Chthoniobacterales bacterium]|nr:phosphatase PAP2 family protein [Chthoniobacterales bacterium]
MTTRRALLWWLVFAAAAGLILAASFQLDAAVQSWMREHRAPGIRSVMRWVSYIGDWVGHAVAALIGAGIAYLRQNRRWLRICVAMIVALAIAGVATRVVKVAAGRSRPSVEIDAGFNGPRFTAKYHAFPSGHMAASLAYFGIIGFANVRLFVALLPIPLVIGFARLYVGAHHFSDVIGGALMGAAIAVLVAGWPRFQIANHKPATAD